MTLNRFSSNPLIHTELGESIGANINGPTLIKVPDFITKPLGQYYLYFAHHQGKHIRMAYADSPQGPYTLYKPGVLLLDHTPFNNHIASPDVHVDWENSKIFMIYHGQGQDIKDSPYKQISCYAQSSNGIEFLSNSEYLAPSYLRIFFFKGYWYGCDGGPYREWRRALVPEGPYEKGAILEIPEEAYPKGDGQNDLHIKRMRHLSFDTSRAESHNRLDIYYSNVGDAPERIKRVSVDLSGDWSGWTGRNVMEIARPATELEGVNQPVEPSENGARHEPVNQLRDPYIFNGGQNKILIYSHAGETGLSGGILTS